MDIGCGMEFQFPVGNNLSGFGDGPTEIHDKLDLGTGQLLDSVTVPASCTDHDTSEKHLTAADFKLDLGPANDLVSCTDFHLETSVSDISSESTIPEECSEGYSIVNSALEGGSIPKPTIPVSCALNLGNVSNVQTVQLNQVNLSQIQSMQVIPIQNMQMLSNMRPVQTVNKVQSLSTEGLKVNIPGVVTPTPPSAVLLGNVLLLQTLPRQVCVPNNINRVVPSSTGIGQTQVLQILNTSTGNHQRRPYPTQPVSQTFTAPSISTTFSPEATVSSILNSRSQGLSLSNSNFQTQNRVPSRETQDVPCGNVMSLNPPAVAQQLQSTGALDLTTQQGCGIANISSQKNTKILVYGKNIALTFDCRNQKYVMNTLAKAMNNSVTGHSERPKTQNNVANNIPGVVINNGKAIDNVLSLGTTQTIGNSVSIQQPVKYVSILKPTVNNLSNSHTALAQNAHSPAGIGVNPGMCNTSTASVLQDRSCLPNNAYVQNNCIIKDSSLSSFVNPNSFTSSEITVINVNTNLQKDKVSHVSGSTSVTPFKAPLEPMSSDKIDTIKKGLTTQLALTHKNNDIIGLHSYYKKRKVVEVERQNKLSHDADNDSDESLSDDSEDETGKVPEYKYRCDVCNAAFNRQGNYNRHRLIHTVKEKDNHRYQCPECGRQFLQRCDMKRHMLIHSKQEPYRCDECGKGYIRKSDLVVHMRFHKKEKAFKCHLCSKGFYQSGDLNRHIRTLHFASSLIKCGHCKKQFAKNATLTKHMQTAHRCVIDQILHDKNGTENGNDSESLETSEGCVQNSTNEQQDSN